LRGETELTLAKPRLREKSKGTKSSGKRKESMASPHDEALFEKLRDLRKKIADELNVPPYIVFGDATLIHMAQLKPETAEQMLDVNGVGQVKLERFGQAFLAVLRDSQ